MLIPFDILLLEWCEYFKLGHPISNVIMVKLTVLNQKLEQVHIQQLCILEHQGLPLPSINCHIILFSHVFLLLHKTISYHFPHNCPDGSKVFLVPLFANFVIFFYQVSQTIKCKAGLHWQFFLPRILLFWDHHNKKPGQGYLWDLLNRWQSVNQWWQC